MVQQHIVSEISADHYQFWLSRRPRLSHILEQSGHENVLAYLSNFLQSRLSIPDEQRQQECIAAIVQLVTERLSPTIAAQVQAQLRQYYVVSTSDHHASPFPPLAFSSNWYITAALTQLAVAQPSSIVLTCSAVSLNHHDQPRGLVWHKPADVTQTQRVTFFPSRMQMYPVYGCPGYEQKRLVELRNKVTQPMLKQLLQDVYLNAQVDTKSLCTQLTQTGWQSWQRVQQVTGAPNTGLIYLEEETVTTRLLLQHHLNTKTVLGRLLFDATYRAKLLPELTTAMGQFLPQGNAGTTLFWGLTPNSHHRITLQLEGNALVNHAAGISIPLQPEAIQLALVEQRIFPNLLLCYATLALYYQLTCLGGFNQLHYLATMQVVYRELADDPHYRPMRLNQLTYGLGTAYLTNGTTLTKATGLDLYLYGDVGTYQRWLYALQEQTVADAMTLLAADVIRYFPELSQLAATTHYRLTQADTTTNPGPLLHI